MNESDKLPNGTRLALPAGFYVPASVDSHRKHQGVYRREEFIMVKARLGSKASTLQIPRGSLPSRLKTLATVSETPRSSQFFGRCVTWDTLFNVSQSQLPHLFQVKMTSVSTSQTIRRIFKNIRNLKSFV